MLTGVLRGVPWILAPEEIKLVRLGLDVPLLVLDVLLCYGGGKHIPLSLIHI